MITKKKVFMCMALSICLMLGACSMPEMLMSFSEQKGKDNQTSDVSEIETVAFNETEVVQQETVLMADTKAEDQRAESGKTDAKTETSCEESGQTEKKIQEMIAGMTIEEKVAQLFIVTPEVVCGYSDYTMTACDETFISEFDEIPVGGLIIMGANLIGEAQTKEMLGDMQAESMTRTGLPLFMCVDEEGGTVARVSGSGNFPVPVTEDMRTVGERGDTSEARQIGITMGTYLRELGFNVDFAPVADVLTNPENVVVYDRSFGSDPYLVAEMDAAFSDGLRSCGVLSTYKHFPGHGATEADTHEGYAYTMKTWDELLEAELVPFIKGIEDEVPLIMMGHISLPSVTGDDTPASLSDKIITDHLINELNYKGLIVTDALEMGAIVEGYSSAEAALAALRAGNDLLLMPADFQGAYTGVLEAVKNGTLPEARIDASLEKIFTAKLRLTEDATDLTKEENDVDQ